MIQLQAATIRSDLHGSGANQVHFVDHHVLGIVVRDENSAIVLAESDREEKFVTGVLYHHNSTRQVHYEWVSGCYHDVLASARVCLFERSMGMPCGTLKLAAAK